MFAARPLDSIGDRSALATHKSLWIGLLWVLLLVPGSKAQEAFPESGLTLVRAVQLALEQDPEIRLVANQVDSSEGAVLSAAGTFDPLLTSTLTGDDSRIPEPGDATRRTEGLETIIGWSQTLRSGQTLEPQLTLDRATDSTATVNTASVSFTWRQPLWRGRQGDVVQAGERSTRHELQAARFDLAHTTAQRLLAVVSQYWTVKASYLDLEILRSTEDSSRDLLTTTRRLIEAQLTPAAELVQLEADLVLREANRVVGERNLYAAIQQLGNELGLTAEEIAELTLPADPFPTVEPPAIPRQASAFLRQAFSQRADLLASQERLRAEEQRLRVADDALEPRLDLVLTPSYTGLVEGTGGDDYLTPLWTQVPGLSASFGFEFSFPLRNRGAAGEALQARAAVDRGQLLIERDRKRIGSRVPSALDAVYRNAERLEKLEQAVQLFERTVENETKKLRAGTSTLIDVISQRDRLTSALQARNAAQLALAISLAELRFETGTLVEIGSGIATTVRHENLTTLPTPQPTP